MVRIPENWSDWEIVNEDDPGEGAYSVVYEAARKDDPAVRCAIKVITVPKDRGEMKSLEAEGMDTEMIHSFFAGVVNDYAQEVRMMEKLRGIQNIVSIEDYKVIPREDGIGSQIFIRMEWLKPLDTYLSDKTLSEAEILQIGIDICTALSFCQGRKIIHRDIKPANIFVNDQIGTHVFYKLGDFGIARSLEGKSLGMSEKGTPNYMAPEVALHLPYDATADIYSLGLTLYWLLNGKRLPFYPQTQLYPYKAGEEALTKRLMGEELPPPIHASEAAARVILKACAFRKEERYATPSEMRDALMALKNRDPADAPPQMPLSGTENPPEPAPDPKGGNPPEQASVPKEGNPPEPAQKGPKDTAVQKKRPAWWVMLAILLLVSGLLIYVLRPGQTSGPKPDSSPAIASETASPDPAAPTAEETRKNKAPSVTPATGEDGNTSRIDELMESISQSNLSQYQSGEGSAQDDAAESGSHE